MKFGTKVSCKDTCKYVKKSAVTNMATLRTFEVLYYEWDLCSAVSSVLKEIIVHFFCVTLLKLRTVNKHCFQ